jgi:hypothetical protein
MTDTSRSLRRGCDCPKSGNSVPHPRQSPALSIAPPHFALSKNFSSLKFKHSNLPESVRPVLYLINKSRGLCQEMSERGHFRGGGGRGRGGRGGGGGGRGGGGQGSQAEKPKKENILDLTKYMDKQVNVKFNGGRESKCRRTSVIRE